MIEASEDDWITPPPYLHWFVREEPRIEEETENVNSEDSIQGIIGQAAEVPTTTQASLHPTYCKRVVVRLS